MKKHWKDILIVALLGIGLFFIVRAEVALHKQVKANQTNIQQIANFLNQKAVDNPTIQKPSATAPQTKK